MAECVDGRIERYQFVRSFAEGRGDKEKREVGKWMDRWMGGSPPAAWWIVYTNFFHRGGEFEINKFLFSWGEEEMEKKKKGSWKI